MKHIGVLLAAGAGSRFGGAYPGAKLDQLIDGVAVGVRAFENLAAAVDHVVVVVRDPDSVLALYARSHAATVIVNEAPERGMGHSLALAAQVVLTKFDSAQFIWASMADLPFIKNNTFALLSPRHTGKVSDNRYLIVQPVFEVAINSHATLGPRARAYLGLPCHPVVFGRAHWPAIAALDGDQGAKQIIAANREHVVRVPTSDEGIWRDIDSPSDLER